MIKIAEIYVPITFSNLREVIPSGVDILYSTLCKGRAEELLGNKKRIYTWTSHVLITTTGIAFTLPVNVSHSKWARIGGETPSGLHFYKWHRISLTSNGFFACAIKGEVRLSCTFILAREVNFESQEIYNARVAQFLTKFSSLNDQYTGEMESRIYEILKADYKISAPLVEQALGEQICIRLYHKIKKQRKSEIKLMAKQAKIEAKQLKREEKLKKKGKK